MVRDSLTNETAPMSVARMIPYDDSRTLSKAALAASDSDKHVLARILGHRLKPGTRRRKGQPLGDFVFLCRWKGYSAEHDTYEPYANIKDTLPWLQYRKHYSELKPRN